MKIEQDFLLDAFVKAFNFEFITKDKMEKELEIFISQLNSWEAEYEDLKRKNDSEVSEFQPINMYDYIIGKIGIDKLGGRYMYHNNKYELIDKFLPGNSDFKTEVGKLVNTTIEKYKSDIVNGNPEVGNWKYKPLIDFIESKINIDTIPIQDEFIINPPLSKLVLKNFKDFKESFISYKGKYGNESKFISLLIRFMNYGEIADLFHQSYYYLSQNEINSKDLVILNFGFHPYKFEIKCSPDVDYFIKSAGGAIWPIKNMRTTQESIFSVFIIGGGLIKKIAVDKFGLAQAGGVHNIRRDIKKINIIEKSVLQLYYHGIHEPSNIVMDTYQDALNLQETLMRIKGA
jgi:hypothetical protein